MSDENVIDRVGADVAVVAAKVSPVALVTVTGLTLNEWVAVVTIAYIVIQAAYLVWKWRRDFRASKAPKGEA